MKIGFYSPYFDSLSGGERYVLTLASHWSKTHEVTLFWDDAAIVRKATERLHIDLSRVTTTENVFATRNIFKKMIISRGYDLIFFLTDGSIPTTFAKYNILHFQVPFQHIPVYPIKLGRFRATVCNSDFTKSNIDARLGARAIVIYPPVTPIQKLKIGKKKRILSVGRLHPLKKQHILIEAFRQGMKRGMFKDYELVLAGGLLPADDGYMGELKESSKGIGVRMLPNCTFDALTKLYNESAIYWHAAGYRETNPERMEHFGITTVEAMSAGCVPFAYAAGGLPEIIRQGSDGFLWADTGDLLDKTDMVLRDKRLQARMSKSAAVRSHEFSVDKFIQAFDELIAPYAHT